jgi:hypothetical protein
MRWMAMALVLSAGVAADAVYQERQTCAQLAELTEELHELRGRPQLPVMLSGEEHQLLERMIAARLTQVAAQPTASAAASPPPLAQEPQLPGPEQPAAVDEASRSIDAAIASGTVSRIDLHQIESKLASLDPATAHQLRRRIAMALNLNQLSLEPRR